MRDRFSPKKPSVPAAGSTPCPIVPAAAPRGTGDVTGPETDIPFTGMTGVPASQPTRPVPWLREARSASPQAVDSAAAAGRAGSPASASAAS